MTAKETKLQREKRLRRADKRRHARICVEYDKIARRYRNERDELATENQQLKAALAKANICLCFNRDR